MIDILKHYFFAFLHPVQTQQALRDYRKNIELHHPLKIVNSPDDLDPKEADFSLSLAEILGASWLFVIIKSIYAIIGVYIGIGIYSEMSAEASPYLNFLDGFSFNAKKLALFTILFDAVFFPFYGLFYVKVWEFLIRLFCSLFSKETLNGSGARQVVNYSLVSNMFLLVPVFGEVARFLSSIFYLFIGLKRNLGFSRAQAIVVLISPLVFFSFIIFLLIIYWVLIFTVMLS